MEITVIGIAGGTGSGKSTFTNRLKEQFGDKIAVIYYDNYYRAQDDVPFEERKKVNYDSPDSLETDLMISHLRALKEGKTIECPTYDYTVHNRSKETVVIEPRKVIIVEGILIFQNPTLRDMLDIGRKYGAQWYCAGAITKKGHPHHPLYLRKDEKLRPFDVEHYLGSI